MPGPKAAAGTQGPIPRSAPARALECAVCDNDDPDSIGELEPCDGGCGRWFCQDGGCAEKLGIYNFRKNHEGDYDPETDTYDANYVCSDCRRDTKRAGRRAARREQERDALAKAKAKAKELYEPSDAPHGELKKPLLLQTSDDPYER